MVPFREWCPWASGAAVSCSRIRRTRPGLREAGSIAPSSTGLGPTRTQPPSASIGPHLRLILLLSLLAPLIPSTLQAAPAASLALGANFNEHLEAARLPALDATGVRWIRGFLPATEFLDGPRRLASDPGLATFRAAAATGRKLALSLKWDFLKSKTRVPAPGSPREQACFAWAIEVARLGRPDLLLLLNELYIDTPDTDLRPGADGVIPMVRFLQRLAAHVRAAGLAASGGAPLPVGCGGFTRLNLPAMQNHPATRALLPWLAASPDLTHVNFHLHHADFAEMAAALAFLRAQCPGRPFVITEFSLVRAYARHLEESLGQTGAGRAFAEAYRRDARSTVRQYLDSCARTPVTEEELHAFLRSRSWFNPQFLEESCRLMEQQGVVLATYAYLQESSGLENPLRPMPRGAPPWRINPVFQERHAFVPGSPRMATNPGIFSTFVQRQP